MLILFTFVIISYLLCSFSSAIIICKLFGLPDPRTQGSKNPGTTNVLRIGGKIPAALTLFGDALKGLLPIAIARYFDIELGPIMIACVLGHIYPIYFKFKGGKGVATAIGAYISFSPIIALGLITTWLITALITRISSLSALIAAMSAPIFTFFLFNNNMYIYSIIISLIVTLTHIENIKRIINGTEKKIGDKKANNH